ncbi:hypothetical protein [Bacillus sp. S/N-304-OC-R1]|uniref:hypothetical protein n=1 Tax=Bacillus sp. S/N-304-OC-R1 TaxID=2758034 RepID=UPI0021AF953F|nr:hypothetical protein [Bacillus sp. S/N-304-OC-R1]
MSEVSIGKYPSEIMEGVRTMLMQSLEGTLSDAEINEQIEALSKSKVMDHYLNSLKGTIGTIEICRAVNQIFGLDLLTKLMLPDAIASLTTLEGNDLTPKLAIDQYLNRCSSNLTGSEIRKMINQLFGINLDGISSLENSGISLYSKGQWISRQDFDLFVVHTGIGDIDVKVIPTAYFTEKTGSDHLPENLQQSLSSLGFYYDEEVGAFYYANPSGQAVPDAFKRKTMGAIMNAIEHMDI